MGSILLCHFNRDLLHSAYFRRMSPSKYEVILVIYNYSVAAIFWKKDLVLSVLSLRAWSHSYHSCQQYFAFTFFWKHNAFFGDSLGLSFQPVQANEEKLLNACPFMVLAWQVTLLSCHLHKELSVLSKFLLRKNWSQRSWNCSLEIYMSWYLFFCFL